MPLSQHSPLPVTADDLLGVVREPLLVLDADLRVCRASRSFYEFFAVTPPETIGCLVYELGHGQWNIPALRQLLEEALPRQSWFKNFEVTHHFASIGRKVMLLNARRFQGTGTRSPLILLAFEDVTERREFQSRLPSTEAAITESERRLRALATASGAVLYQLSADWSELQPLDGKGLVPSNDAPIRGWFERDVARSDHVSVRERIAHAIATKSTFEMEHRVNRPDGSIGWTLSRAVPLLDASGQITEWIGAANDVTARREADERLRASEERFRRAIGIGTVGVLFFSLDGRIHEANATFERMSGYTLEELRATTDWTALTAHEFLGVTARTADGLATTGLVEPHEKQMVRKDGTRWWGHFAPTRLSGTGRDAQCVEFIIDISKAKQDEEALRESERRFRALVRAGGGDIVYRMNPDWSEMRQLDGQGLIRDTANPDSSWLTEYVFADDQPHVMAAIRDAVRTQGVFELEHRVRRVDGTLGWVLSRAVPLLDATGRITDWVGVASDVTARKQAEEGRERVLRALDNERSKLSAIVEKAPAFMATLRGPEHVIELANEEYFKLIGRREVVGRAVRDALPEVVDQGFINVLDTVYRSGEPFIGNEVPAVLGPLGAAQERVINFVYQALREPDGSIGGIFVHGIDVTEMVRVREAAVAREEALRTSEERLAFSVGAGELGTFYCPMPMATIIWNDKCKEHFWLPPDAEVSIDTFYAILHPEDRERTRVAIEQSILERRAYDIEYRTVAPDGRIRWVRAKGRAYYGQDNQPTRFDGVTLDVTEQKQAEVERQAYLEREQAARAEAEQASRMKDEFLATLGHELRTPLNAILGWSHILRSGSPASPADIQQGLETIERNARAQTAIIEDLLDMSRIISGKVRLDVQRIDLPPVVQAAVDTVRPAADAKGVQLQVVLDSLRGPVSGDPNRLQQVFWNLLTNAVKFTPRDGRVQVLLKRVDSHLEVSVIDTGEGISPQFLPHVFDRFRQSDSSSTRRHGGLGLGLAIAKQLVEMHGGSIHATSLGAGQGAAFTVALPLTIVHAQPAQPSERNQPPAEGMPLVAGMSDRLVGLTVLVVDDEPDARALVKRLLEDCRASVLVAGSAAEALDRLVANRPDVIVSDIGMPEENGYSLIRKIRALRPERGGKTPAVALTAYARAEDRINAVTAGFQHHVAKPVEPAELITMVASLGRGTK